MDNIERLKLKNIKDLEYNHILTKQNTILVIIGTAVVSTIFSNKIPEGISKYNLILSMILITILFLLHYSNELSKIIEDINKL